MSIAKTVEEYISRHPSIKDCLKQDLVNFSSLSRKIANDCDLKKKDFDAILISCRRIQLKLRKSIAENDILSVMRKSKIEAKNKIAVFVIEKDVLPLTLLNLEKEILKENETSRIIEGASGITIITSEDASEIVKKYLKNKIIVENKHLAEIIIKSPKEIEGVPGAYAYLCSIFWENGINIVETLSCWTDTIFIVDEKDVGRIMGFLRF